MGVTFDEEWEYYQPDEEIQELIEESQKKDRKSHLVRTDDNTAWLLRNSIARRCNGKLDDIRSDYIVQAYKDGASYSQIAELTGLSRDTVRVALNSKGVKLNRRVPIPEKKRNKKCLWCSEKFPRYKRGLMFCSHSCSRLYSLRNPKHEKKRRFVKMYKDRTLTLWDISNILGCEYRTLQKWRKELNLPTRRKAPCNTSEK